MERKLGRRQLLSALAGSGALALSGVAFARYDAARVLLSSRRTGPMTSPARLPSERLPEQGRRFDSLGYRHRRRHDVFHLDGLRL
jgi:hypothetical protein